VTRTARQQISRFVGASCMAATLALTAGGTGAVSAPQRVPFAAPEQTEPPSPSESPSPSSSASPSLSESPPPSPSSSASPSEPPSPSEPSSSEPPSSEPPSSSEPSSSSESPSSEPPSSSSKSDESKKEDEEKMDEEELKNQLDDVEAFADTDAPEEVKEEVSQASAGLKELLDPEAETPPDVRDTIERTLEPLTDALKVIQDPKTSPEDRDTVEKIVKQLKVVIVDFPKTPPKDWHAIGTCVEQLKLVINEFPNLTPHIRHDLGKLMEDSSTILELIHDPKILPIDREMIETTVGPVTDTVKITLDPKTSMKIRKKVEKSVDRIIDAVSALRNPRAPKKDRDEAHEKIEQSRRDVNRMNRSQCFEVELVYAPGSWGNKPFSKDDGGWATSAIEQELSPPKEVGKVVLDWDYPTDHDLNDPSDAQKSVASGSKSLAKYVNDKDKLCKGKTKFILIGYSQGANVITDALGGDTDGAYAGGQSKPTNGEKIEIGDRIHSIVLIGNPNRKAHPEEIPRVPDGTETRVPDGTGKGAYNYKNKTLDICTEGDLWCTPGSDPWPNSRPWEHFGWAYQINIMDEVGECLRKEIVDEDECDHDQLNQSAAPGNKGPG
jgi:hypothetical protein